MAKTPWGDPDLQGTWDYRTITPLERSLQLGNREFYTEEEKQTLEGRAGRRMDGPPEKIQPGLTHAQYATDPGRFIADGNRTSLIVDPPDGRMPSLTAEAKVRQGRGGNRNNTVNASWLDRGNQERCITYGLPSASLPTLYNNNIQIVQAPGTAVIVHEMIHEARVVPLDGRPRLNAERPRLDRRLARLVGRRHAGRRDDELQRQEQLPRLDDRSAPGRALHARRRGPARAPAHGQRPDDVGETVDGAAADAADRRRDSSSTRVTNTT